MVEIEVEKDEKKEEEKEVDTLVWIVRAYPSASAQTETNFQKT